MREFIRYFSASLIALGVDMTVLLLGARVTHYLAAASAGFMAGTAVSYLLATRWVFGIRRLAHRRRTEFAVYLAIGGAGLAINDAVMFLCVGVMDIPLFGAKLCAAAVTFLSNFGLRKLSLFR